MLQAAYTYSMVSGAHCTQRNEPPLPPHFFSSLAHLQRWPCYGSWFYWPTVYRPFFLHALVRHVACLQEIRKRLSLDQMPQWVPVAHFRSLSTSCAALKNWTLSAVVATLLLKIRVSQHEQAEQGHSLRHRASFVLVVCVVSRCALLLSICAATPTFQEHWRVKLLVCLVEASFTWS